MSTAEGIAATEKHIDELVQKLNAVRHIPEATEQLTLLRAELLIAEKRLSAYNRELATLN